MWAAGVRADVAADARGALARGVRREEEPERVRRAREVEVHDTRLDERGPRELIDRDDLVQPRGGHDDGAGAGDGAAGKTSAGAARHDGPARRMGGLHHIRDLGGGAGYDDGARRLAIEAGVVLEHDQVLGAPEHVVLAADALELGDEGHVLSAAGVWAARCAAVWRASATATSAALVRAPRPLRGLRPP